MRGMRLAGILARSGPLTALLLLFASSAVWAGNGAASAWTKSLPDPSEFVEILLLQNYNTRLVVGGTTLLGATCGLVGTFLLLRKRSLLGDSLAHATLPGIGIAFMLMVAAGFTGKNLPGLLAGATASGAAGMLAVLAIRNTTRLKDDAAMGIALSVSFGIGIAVLRLTQNMPQGSAAGLESFIYGKTASMVFSDFWLITGVSLCTTVACAMVLKELTLLCFDEQYAAAQGWPTLYLDFLLIGLVIAVTVVGLQSVGLILIIAFLITPASAARFWTNRYTSMILLAGVIGAVSGWFGSSFSALLPRLPAGAIIVLTAASIFLFSMFFGTARGVLLRWIEHRRLRRRVGRQHLLRAAYEILETGSNQPHIPNVSIPFPQLLAHRSWSAAHLRKLLRDARREDHLEPSAPGTIRLSENGFGEAARITRNHRLWELYLIRHADIAPSHVDRDADMVEHILGAELVHQLEAELQPRAAVPASPHDITAAAAP